jgi:ferritin-like metal-binding protein YciE
VKYIYYAEEQILKALPKMAKKASSEDLSAASLPISRKPRGRLQGLRRSSRSSTSRRAAIEGILEEGAYEISR